MMLADPGRVHAELIGVERLGGDIGDELVGVPRIVLVVIVAEGEVAEFHVRLLRLAAARRLCFTGNNAAAIVVNAIVEPAIVTRYFTHVFRSALLPQTTFRGPLRGRPLASRSRQLPAVSHQSRWLRAGGELHRHGAD